MTGLPTMNRLLTALPARDRNRLLQSCDEVELQFLDVLLEPGQRIAHVYFPVEGFISMLIPFEGRTTLEIELIGNEGMLGVPVVLGLDVSPFRALVQGSGTALRMRASAFRRELLLSPALRRRMNHYIYVLLAQLAQSAACISFHLLEARLARWLLMTHDRAHSDEFRLTHEFLAGMLGVRRVGVTNSAGLLQSRKLLRYNRGKITVLDRQGLEATACSCYEAAKATYESALH